VDVARARRADQGRTGVRALSRRPEPGHDTADFDKEYRLPEKVVNSSFAVSGSRSIEISSLGILRIAVKHAIKHGQDHEGQERGTNDASDDDSS